MDNILTATKSMTPKAKTAFMLDKWRGSDTIEAMKTANEYYRRRNVAIRGKERDYKDAAGQTVKSELSNQKIPSGFLRASVDQKVNYAFGNPFTLAVENMELTAEQREADTNAEVYLSEWNDLITPQFRNTVKRIVKNAVNNGIGWAYVWIGDDERLHIVDVPSETIYPKWDDRAHTSLDFIVRDYKVTDMSSGEDIEKVEYWDRETMLTIEGDEQTGDLTFHMTAGDNGVGWGRVPFIFIKSGDDELPLLNLIKEQIDAYDLHMSKSSDSLLDDIDPVLVLRSYSSEIGELQAARKLLKDFRIAAVDGDGDAKYLQVQADISATQAKLEHLRKDIREFGASVDTQDVKFGSNPSGIALRAMYQDLDIYINGIETEFEVFFDNLKFFFDKWLEYRGIGTAEQWGAYRVIVTLVRDMMINEGEYIDKAAKLQGMVSQQTLDEYLPIVESHEVEQARRDAEQPPGALEQFRRILTENEETEE